MVVRHILYCMLFGGSPRGVYSPPGSSSYPMVLQGVRGCPGGEAGGEAVAPPSGGPLGGSPPTALKGALAFWGSEGYFSSRCLAQKSIPYQYPFRATRRNLPRSLFFKDLSIPPRYQMIKLLAALVFTWVSLVFICFHNISLFAWSCYLPICNDILS